MIAARSELRILAPPERVFDYLADARNEPRWLPGAERVEKATDGPVGLHTRFDGVYARAGAVSVELVEFDRPRKLTFRATAKIVVFDDEVELTPDADGTLLVARLSARPRGVMRVFTPLLARTMRRQFEQNWPHLKQAVEAAP